MRNNHGVDLEDLRLAVYHSFITAGCPPDTVELASGFGVDASEVTAGLRRLADVRQVVLGDDEAIVMAHPFAATPLGFSAMGASTLWWGGCAWDSFALPHLLDDESSVLVATRCPTCALPMAWDVNRHEPPIGDQVAHFLVPVAHIWDDVVHACAHQRIFCSSACIDAWLAETGNTRGSVLDLATLWRLAAHWYDGRLDRGYVRREPSAAAQYFREVGLTGAFWGL